MPNPKRQTNRKVIIRFSGREPSDPQRIMDAVEAAFRPKDIEVEIDSQVEADDGQRIANELLESKLIPAVKASLDSRAESNAPVTAPAVAEAKTRTWLQRYWAVGWAIIVSAATVGANVKKIFFQ